MLPTRERILNEVERLIVLEGVHGFKLRDVADRLDMQVPAIYKHYKSRDDVLAEVSRRLILGLAAQFGPSGESQPERALRSALNRLVAFEMHHPAFVRLALIDFAAPSSGTEHVKQAARGSFRDSVACAPLAPIYRRLRRLLRAGERARRFKRMPAGDFCRLIGAALLVRLVFPDDRLLRRPTPAQVRSVQRWLWELASGILAIRAPARRR